MNTASPIKLIAFPVKELSAAKKLFSTYLGDEPYVDSDYYVGYRVGDVEVGLDPNALAQGFAAPICYTDTADIQTSIKSLVDAGAEVVAKPTEVSPGLQIAKLRDANGNLIGLRQGFK